MKVYIDSYNKVFQNPAGGVKTRLLNLEREFGSLDLDFKYFNKWEDNIRDCDIYHYFKAHRESYDLINHAKNASKKIVLSSIMPISNSFQSRITRFLTPLRNSNFFLAASMNLSDKIICQTVYERDFIKKKYSIPYNKIEVIPNGVSTEILQHSSQIFCNKFNISDGFVLQIGCIEKNKNQLSVIKALRNTDIPVVFIGGPNPSQMKYWEECQSSSSSNMLFTGWITDHSLLYSALRAAKVLILPSHYEIFGNSLFEGGLAGCNLVSTNVLPLKSWGMDSMVYSINPNSILDIEQNVKEALNQPKNISLSQLIERKFSWNVVAKSYLELYKSILK